MNLARRTTVYIALHNYPKFLSFSNMLVCRMLSTSPLTRFQAVQAERDQYIKLSREEKRQLYKCRSHYKTIGDIPTWPEYACEQEITTPSDAKKEFPYDSKLNDVMSVWRGDITTLEVDAIVNAANSGLRAGGGVCGAIHSAAGSQLETECHMLHGRCDTGSAKLTAGYKLPATYVLHAVGPQGENSELLSSTYRTCLDLCLQHDIKTVAFPCISTGIYGYPNDKAAQVALRTIRGWLQISDNRDKLTRIVCCVFLEVDVTLYEKLLPVYFPLS